MTNTASLKFSEPIMDQCNTHATQGYLDNLAWLKLHMLCPQHSHDQLKKLPS